MKMGGACLKGNEGTFTVSGTNIEDVKKKNEQSGMSYNEVKQMLAAAIVNQEAGIQNEAKSIRSKDSSSMYKE